MLGRWLSTGLCDHKVSDPVHWAHSLHHTWSHRWSCSCKVQWGGCSLFYLRWCWCGSELDTVQLQHGNKNVFLVTLISEKTIILIPLILNGHTFTQRKRLVPMSSSLAQQFGRAYQLKAKFTVELAGRTETIRSIGIEAVVKTLLWSRQWLACDCWRENNKNFSI